MYKHHFLLLFPCRFPIQTPARFKAVEVITLRCRWVQLLVIYLPESRPVITSVLYLAAGETSNQIYNFSTRDASLAQWGPSAGTISQELGGTGGKYPGFGVRGWVWHSWVLLSGSGEGGWGQEGDRSPPRPTKGNTFPRETQELLLKERKDISFHTVSIQACLGKISTGTMSKMSLISL